VQGVATAGEPSHREEQRAALGRFLRPERVANPDLLAA